MKCETCGYDREVLINKNTISIKELGLEFTQPVPWTKPYNEIVVPKGWKLPSVKTMIDVLDNEEIMKNIGLPIDTYIAVPCQQLNIDKKNNSSRWACRYGGGNLCCGGERLLSSNAAGLVVFVRKVKQ